MLCIDQTCTIPLDPVQKIGSFGCDTMRFVSEMSATNLMGEPL